MQFHERGVSRLARALAFAAGVSVASLPAFVPFPAQAEAGPFATLSGVWTGGGTVSLENGTKERLRCRVQYVTTNEGNNLQQSLNCDSASYHFHVNAYVNYKGGSLSGNWTETTRNASGSISGKASGGKIFVSVAAGSAFSAKMTMITSGNSQSVNIKPKGTDVTDVSVTVSKSH
jgi:hypothetical protein